MSSNSVRHNDDLNPFIRSYDVKSLQSVLYSVVEGKTEEAYVIVRNSRNYPIHDQQRYGRIFCLESQKIDGMYQRYNHYFKFF